VAHPYQHAELIPLSVYRDRFNRTGLAPEKVVGRLVCAIEIHDSVHPLLQRAHTTIAHMSAVVVVTEENGTGDEIFGADGKIVRAQNLHSRFVPLGAICRAGTIAVFRNDNGFAGKGNMNLVEIACGLAGVAGAPKRFQFFLRCGWQFRAGPPPMWRSGEARSSGIAAAGRVGDHRGMGFNKRRMESERAAAAAKAAEARRALGRQVVDDVERLVADWNARQEGHMPMLFSPTIGAAITAGYWFLRARCPACRTTGDVDLRALDWHRGAAV